MRRPVTVKAFGGPPEVEALMQRLDGAVELAGWRRETFGFPPLGCTPNALVFEAPRKCFPVVTRVVIRRDATKREVEVTAVHVEDMRPESAEYLRLHDVAVLAFARDVLAPAAEAVGTALCMTPQDVRIDDLVAPVVADRLHAFAGSDVRDAQIHPDDEARFLRLVAIVHATHTDLDGATLPQWLAEDVRWPASLAGRLGRDLDRGRALLAAHDRLCAGLTRVGDATKEGS